MLDTIVKLWPVLSGGGVAIFYLVIKVYINTQMLKTLRYDLQDIKKSVQCTVIKDYVQENFPSQKTCAQIRGK